MAVSPTGSIFLSASLLLFLLLCSLNNGHALERRETEESHHSTVQISSLLPLPVCNPSSKGTNKESSLKLIHKHGPCSKLTQHKANPPTLTQILSQDQSRVNSINSRLSFNSGKPTLQVSKAKLPANSGSSLGTGNYFVTVGLGAPKRDLSLIFDTGSDLTWTQCQPCVKFCYNQQQPKFDPSVSKTYSNITCNTTLCSQLISTTGIKPVCSGTTCIYGIQYGDQSYSSGYFGQDKLTLTPSDVFDKFLFGCGQNNRGLFGGAAGLLGLGRDKLSFVSQTAQKYGKYFSYCLPSTPSSTGHLTFGKSNGVPSVKFTSLLIDSKNPSFYFIDIIGISVGGRQLSISPSVFKTVGTLIDSGTVITRLPLSAYSAMRTVFRQQMTKYPMGQAVSILDTCYDFSNYTSVLVPRIRFFFGGNVTVDLDPSGVLYGVRQSQVCLAFAGNSDASDTGIFGNVQQKTLEVVYDVAGGKLGFGSGGCA